jgi:hypothetical protein
LLSEASPRALAEIARDDLTGPQGPVMPPRLLSEDATLAAAMLSKNRRRSRGASVETDTIHHTAMVFVDPCKLENASRLSIHLCRVFQLFRLAVEMTGLEPVTSWLQTTRSPS